MMLRSLVLGATLFGAALSAEVRDYGRIGLGGLARESWGLNPLGVSSVMVCNVNGDDGFLSIRSGPGTNYEINRKLNRLATVEVDTRHRKGRWIRVETAYRDFSKSGQPVQHKSLHVSGWAHDNYLCDFIDF